MVQSLKIVKSGEMSASDALKMSLGLICGLAADAAVSAALGGLMPAGRGWKHMLRIAGTFVLGMMAGEKAEEYVCKVFDDTKTALTEAKEELKADETAETEKAKE